MKNPILKLLLIITLITFRTISNCQIIEGVLLDDLTKQPIAYVNIGIFNKNIGTVSNEKGEFKLNISDSNYSDAIGFSSIGYYSIEMKVKDLIDASLANFHKICLAPKTYQISEVIVRPKKFKQIESGNGSGSMRKKCGFGPDDKLGREMGTIIPLKGKEAFLDKAIVNIGVNNYGKIKFRLNIYYLENGLPNERVNREPIYFETDIKKGKCVVDLEKYNYKVTKDIFISIEYICYMGEYGLYFTFSFNKNPTFYRETSQSQWVETTYENKRVSISINAILSFEKKK
jgi:hypothetical protein